MISMTRSFPNSLPGIRNRVEGLLSAKAIISVLGFISCILAAWFSLRAGEAWLRLRTFTPPATVVGESVTSTADTPTLESFQSLTSQDIFGTKKVAQTPAAPTAPVSKLKLRLLGTNVTTTGTPFAIIAEETKREEDVFSLRETVFGQARLVEIHSEYVKLENNGVLEILKLDDGPEITTPTESDGTSEQTDFTVPETEVSDALSNLPLLLSQARAVPYFRNGQSIGMRLFAIRRGSLYEKIGLRNGDIIKMVNDNSVSDPTQALKIFEQLKSERAISVKVERNAQDVQLNYSIR